MIVTETPVCSLLIALIGRAWTADFRATIYVTNAGDVARVIASELTADTNVLALSYGGYQHKDGNEDGSFMRGESPTVENYVLSFRIDRSAGQSADEAVGLFHQLRTYLRTHPREGYIRHKGITYRVTLGDGEVLPNDDAGFNSFQIPISLG